MDSSSSSKRMRRLLLLAHVYKFLRSIHVGTFLVPHKTLIIPIILWPYHVCVADGGVGKSIWYDLLHNPMRPEWPTISNKTSRGKKRIIVHWNCTKKQFSDLSKNMFHNLQSIENIFQELWEARYKLDQWHLAKCFNPWNFQMIL